ncbi:hypothetical protein [Aliidiomarina shirensis]|uniref:hypothetical protein n=1 Tax=Aliidiomarina shirensis TaxID=1048642 RepID=UPI000F88878E|nr:hypothetical protein [Aliidiomarina shirensis]
MSTPWMAWIIAPHGRARAILAGTYGSRGSNLASLPLKAAVLGSASVYVGFRWEMSTPWMAWIIAPHGRARAVPGGTQRRCGSYPVPQLST